MWGVELAAGVLACGRLPSEDHVRPRLDLPSSRPRQYYAQLTHLHAPTQPLRYFGAEEEDAHVAPAVDPNAQQYGFGAQPGGFPQQGGFNFGGPMG